MQHDFSIICRHCDVETVEPVHATVTGTIPTYAYGDYYFNSPGIGRVGAAEYCHIFDFGAILQKVHVASSGCSYRSRYLQTSTFTKNQKAGSIAVSEFGTAAIVPPKNDGFFGKLLQMADYSSLMTDNAATSVINQNGKLYAVGDGPTWFEFDPDDLTVKDVEICLSRDLGLMSASSHCTKLSNGNVVTVGQSVTASGTKFNIVEFPSSGEKPQVVGKVSPRWRYSSNIIHSFGVSRDYLVIIDMPVVVRYVDVIKCSIKSTAFIDIFNWLPEESVQLLIIDQKTWKQHRKFSLKNQYVAHITHCHEKDNGDLVLDFESYKGPDLVYSLLTKNLKNPAKYEAMSDHFRGTVTRAILPLSSASPSSEVRVESFPLSDVSISNPILNSNFVLRQYKFLYGSSHTKHDYCRVSKVNVDTGEAIHFIQPGLYMSDILYITNPREK
ncbi:Carotenoid oxygenase, partial [Trinorchestia longiramus]